MKTVTGSGNFMVDAQDEAEELENKITLDCGCKKYCTCDEGDE